MLAISERDALHAQNDRIRHLMLRLQRMEFGRKLERLPEEQRRLGLEALEQAIARGEAEAEKRNPELQKVGVKVTATGATVMVVCDVGPDRRTSFRSASTKVPWLFSRKVLFAVLGMPDSV